MDRTKLQKLLKRYQEYLTFECGLVPYTVQGYSRTLSIALRHMRKFLPSQADVKRHLLWMHEKRYSYSHIVNTSIALEHFGRQKQIPIKIGRPRKPKRIIKGVLTESEVSRIIQSAKNVREKALICLLAYSGLRNSEICDLKVENVDLGSNRVMVEAGKNKKDRIVNISSNCTTVLVEQIFAAISLL